MRRLSIVMLLLLSLQQCNPGPQPFRVAFHVSPTPTGADVRVDVSGSVGASAWVGFGDAESGSDSILDRVTAVRATSSSGQSLPVESVAHAGYRVDLKGSSQWHLLYRLQLLSQRDKEQTYYRTSSRGADYLILVGSDAWARFYTRARELIADPASRRAGSITAATVQFDMRGLPADWVVVSAAPATGDHAYFLTQHPLNTIFAIGPYSVIQPPAESALIVALHRDWSVERSTVVDMIHRLQAELEKQLGKPGTGWSVALFNPVPPALAPATGLRTSRMVRGRTLLLFADVARGAPSSSREIRGAMALFLGHELFHLYVPWGVGIAPALGWLSEGWAMYSGRSAAHAADLLSTRASAEHLQDTYKRYIEIGGFRVGTLPQASMNSSGTRDLLYLRGELVFELLAREWARSGKSGSFQASLWKNLKRTYDGQTPLETEQVRAVLGALVDPTTVRRYVEGNAPITPLEAGLR